MYFVIQNVRFSSFHIIYSLVDIMKKDINIFVSTFLVKCFCHHWL